MKTPNLNRLISESHKRQFAGEDYQAVAIDIAEENGIAFESELYTLLQSSPDPICACGFCQKAQWEE
jgi:hypothetical protein